MKNGTLNTIAASLKRIGLLIRNRFYDEGPGLGIGLAVIAGINLLSLLLAGQAWFNSQGSLGIWSVIITVGVIVISISAFKGMHDGKAGVDWMLLPASPLEKYIAAAVDCCIVYPLLAAGSATLLSWLLSLIQKAIMLHSSNPLMQAYASQIQFWTPMMAGGFKFWGELAITAAVAMAGSATFRKNPFIKTAGIAILYSLVAGAIMMILILIFFRSGNISSSGILGDLGVIQFGGRELSSRANRAIRILVDIAQYGLLPLFAVFYGYFKVYEKEARDEVQ